MNAYLKMRLNGNAFCLKALIEIVREDPCKNPPPHEKLIGSFQGSHSWRINIRHRFVYEVLEEENKVKIIRLWTHYEE